MFTDRLLPSHKFGSKSTALLLAILAVLIVCTGCATGGTPPSQPFVGNPSTGGGTQAIVGAQAPNPIGTVNPASANFGDVPVGSSFGQAFTLTNTGNADLQVSQATLTGSTSMTLTGLTVPLTVSPGQSVPFAVQFAPTATGTATGTLTISSNSASPISPISLTGNGVTAAASQLSANPVAINFGSVTVGKQTTQTLNLTNTGGSPVTVSAIAASGAGFSLVAPPALPLTIATGQTQPVTLQFSPTAAGAATGAVSVTSDASNSPNLISLSGTGTASTQILNLTPTSFDFGTVIVGQSASQTVTMTNTGNAALTVTAANVTGASYSITPPLSLPATLNPGQSQAFTIRFAPTTAGALPGSVSLVSNASNSPTSITLTGSGLAQVLQLSANPSSVGFGDVVVGTSSTQSVTLSNTGNSNITITSAAATGTGFSFSGLTAPLTLVPGQATSFTVRFAPTATGSVAGNVSLVSNAAASPTVIGLTGNGTPVPVLTLDANPISLNFGNVIIGSPDVRNVTLTNTGNTNITVNSAVVGGAGFSIAGLALPVTLTPGQSVPFTAQFAPTTAGASSGSITVASTATNSPATITLQGTGVSPAALLVATPMSITFGSVIVGNTQSQAVTLTNTGNATANITSATLTGTDFSTTGLTIPQALAPGQSSVFNIVFAPTSAGTPSGNIAITSNATNSPTTISFSGTGVAQTRTLVLNPSSIGFGDVVVSTTSTQSATVTNTGNSSVTITAANIAAPYSVTGLPLPLTLSPGQTSAPFNVVFSPTSVANGQPGSVSLVSNATNSPTVMSLTGNGIPAPVGILAANPASFDFGSVIVGNTNTQTFTLMNTGSAAVNVASVVVSGGGSGFSSNLAAVLAGLGTPNVLAPSQSVTFTAQFAPVGAGAVSGNITISSNASNTPTVITLDGTGVAAVLQLNLSPTSIDFGGVIAGSTTSQTLVMANAGNLNLTVTAANFVTGTVYSITPPLSFPFVLTPGQNQSFTVRFAPTSAGVASDTLSIASNDPTPPTVALVGTGIAQVLTLSANPSTIGFGDVIVTNTASQAVLITNTGNTSVTISSPATITGAGFSVTGLTLPLTLNAGQSTSFTARFTPGATGNVSGSISLTSNASNSPTVINLTGNGIQAPVPATLAPNPSSFNFGSVIVGNTASQSFTLMNTSNTNPVNVASFVFTGGAAGFTTNLAPPFTLAPLASTTFTVQFAPSSAVAATDTIRITSDATNSPTDITLNGTGVAAVLQLNASPTSIDFGSVIAGSNNTQTVVMSNAGNLNLSVTAANFATGTAYSITPPLTFPISLTPGQSQSFTVRFAPGSAGVTNDTLTLVSDDSTPPTVALIGTGVAQVLTLSANPSTIGFGNVLVGSNSTQAVTVTNTGNTSVTINSPATVTGAGFSVTGLALPLTLNAGQSASFNARFAPASAGSVSGSISLTSNASNSPTTVSLSGTGVAVVNQLSASPASIDFGNVFVGSISTQSITVTNTGNVNVTLNTATPTGAGFSIIGLTVPQTLTPGQAVTFSARYTPASAGSVSGNISIASTAANSPTVISLTGNGVTPVLQLDVSPTSIDFGGVLVGSNTSQTVVMTNAGNQNLSVTAANVTGASYSINPPLAFPIALTPGQSQTFTIRFAPASAGALPGSVTLISNDPTPPSVTLNGSGVAQVLTLGLNPTSIDFGNVLVGSNVTRSVTVTNTGNTSVTITAANTTSPAGAGFSVTGLTLPLTLTPGQSSSFNARFAPTAGGTFSGSISLVSNASNSPTSVTLAGTGVPVVNTLTANPSSVNFGNVFTGNTATQSVTLTNSGNVNITINTATPSGAGFSLTGLTLPLTLTPGQTTSFTARFAPTSAGAVSGNISIASTAGNSPTVVSLSGTGVSPVATLGANPTSIAFGNVNVGSSAQQTVTVTNTGNVNVTVNSVTPTGTGFSATGLPTFPLTLTPGQTFTYTARFAPASGGTVNGNISVASTATNSPTVTTLSGTGVAQTFLLSANPTSISFGSVFVGSSASQAVTLTNTGNSSVTVTAVTPTGSGFSVSGITLPLTINAGQTTTLSVQFAPASAGSVTGSVSVVSSATNSPATVALDGVGATGSPAITVNPASLNFGNVVVNSSFSQSIQISNTGNQALTITSATVTGTGFAINGLTLPLTLNAGQAATFNAVFTPNATGSFSGSISIVSNAPTSPTAIALSGTGTTGLTLTWDATVSIPISGYRIYRSTTSGSGYILLNPSLVTGVTFVDSSVVPGTTYFYVVTTVALDGFESVNSIELRVVIP